MSVTLHKIVPRPVLVFLEESWESGWELFRVEGLGFRVRRVTVAFLVGKYLNQGDQMNLQRVYGLHTPSYRHIGTIVVEGIWPQFFWVHLVTKNQPLKREELWDPESKSMLPGHRQFKRSACWSAHSTLLTYAMWQRSIFGYGLLVLQVHQHVTCIRGIWLLLCCARAVSNCRRTWANEQLPCWMSRPRASRPSFCRLSRR